MTQHRHPVPVPGCYRCDLREVEARDHHADDARAETITVPRPHIPHGPQGVTEDQADTDYLRNAARDLAEHYKPFGSNLRATVVRLLNDAADALATGRAETTTEASVLSRITDLFEKWAAEENEHRKAAAYGIAEGLRIATEDLREVVHGALDKAADALAAGRAETTTRDQIIDVLVMSPLADTAGTDLRPFEAAADAVLALLDRQATP